MPLPKLVRRPDVAGYVHTEAEETIAIKLDGGKSFVRRDVENAAAMVAVKWNVDRLGFEYLKAFKNTALEGGSLPFLIDLMIDTSTPVEHEAQLVPGSWSTVDLGGAFEVSAKLEVTRNAIDASYDGALIALVDAFGLDEDDIERNLATLARIVNVRLPAAAP